MKKINFKNVAMNAAGVALGTTASKMLGNVVTKNITDASKKDKVNKILPFVKLVGGAVLSEMAKDPFLKNMGLGIVSNGASDFVDQYAKIGNAEVLNIGNADVLNIGDPTVEYVMGPDEQYSTNPYVGNDDENVGYAEEVM
jgi:hypothetical protein